MANYVDSAERAEENRSSAWTLLFVGGIGLAVIILNLLNINLEVIGINTLKYVADNAEGMGFSIAGATFLDILK